MRWRATSNRRRLVFVAIVAVLASSATACRHAMIPYALPAPSPRSAPRHPLRLAILPLVDAQDPSEGPDDARGYVYRGVPYDHTQLDDLEGAPAHRVTELLARHLAAAGSFAQIVLVNDLDEAHHSADLVLSGRIRRLRGYVEARGEDAPLPTRSVIAEVFLEGLEVHASKRPDRVLLRVDAGWSIHESRTFAGGEADPWRVLGEALERSVAQLVAEIDRADLSGAEFARSRVRLEAPPTADAVSPEGARAHPFGALEEAWPEGWIATGTSTASRPLGWSSPKDRRACLEIGATERQGQRFHRALGPYRPVITVWSCPSSEALRIDSLVEFPAMYLGERADGSRLFARTLGASSWPTAIEDVARHLAVEPPKDRYTFELKAR